MVVGLVISLDALSVFWSHMERRDFGAFYASGRAWNERADVYSAGRTDLPNLNPPSMVALVFAPLAHLPLAMAGSLWQCLGIAALAFAVVRGRRELALDTETLVSAVGVLLVTVAARYVWLEGQITWLLMAPATLGWVAYRRGAPIVTGVWLGLIVAIKPFFAITALALGVRVALTAAAVAALITVVGVLVTSLTPWQQWLALGSGISVTWPSSASVWTLGTRLVGATPHDVVTWTSLPLVVAICTLIVAATGCAVAFAQDNRDGRWTIAIGLALLVSPLGWIYYLPLAWGAILAMWLNGGRRRVIGAAVLLCSIPMQVHVWAIAQGRFAGATLGAAYTWAVVLMLWSAMFSERTRGQREHIS
jgi:hypothetical protein